jgi:hypothetical protein
MTLHANSGRASVSVKAVIETIDELMGMESDRHPMFSEGYDYALDHIKQFVRGRDRRDKEEKNT